MEPSMSAPRALEEEDRARRSLGGSLQQWLLESAAAWRLPKRALVAILVVPFVVALGGAASMLLGKDVYIWVTGEDRIAETLQLVFYALALVLGVMVARHLRRTNRSGVAFLYLLVSCGLVFMLGEEVSWGQRVFHWNTPDWLLDINKQKETSLHNIYGVEFAFKWVQLAVGAYGAVLPLLLLRVRLTARLRDFARLVVPHSSLVPYFALLFLWRWYRNLFEAPRRYHFVIMEYNEVLELTLSMGIFLFMVYQLRSLRTER